MDELLNFMEEDINGAGSDDEDPGDNPNIPDPSCRRMTLSPLKNHNNTSSMSQQNVAFKDIFGSPDKRDVKEIGLSKRSSESSMSQQNVTFTDIFGSPDKRDVKELGLTKRSSESSSLKPARKFGSSSLSSQATAFSSSSSSSFPSTTTSVPSQLELSRSIRQDSNVPYKPDSINSMVIDPYSRIRVVKSSISIYYDESMFPEAALKDRNIGMEFVNLATFSVWYRGKGKDQKNFWISGALVRKTPGPRKSAKGNDYHIWELSDLKDLDKKITVFLFGSASGSGLAGTPLGSIVDFTTPSVMHDSSNGQIKFSVNNSTQVRFIGQARDFGYCEARKKDGNKCTAVVNTWECSFCIHHAASELKRLNVGGSKSKGGAGKGKTFPNKSFGGSGGGGFGGESQESLKQQGVFIADFGGRKPLSIGGGGGGALNRSYGGVSSSKQTIVTSRPNLPPSSRMSLQGGVNQMGKNPIKFGNPENMKFIKKGSEDHPLLKKEGVQAPVVRKPLDLNPTKTRHLTDKDRELLSKLDFTQTSSSPAVEKEVADDTQSQSKNKKQKTGHGGPPPAVSELITSSIVNNPTSATRNFMQYLSLQHAPKDQVDLNSSNKTSIIQPMTMSRAKVKCMEKALDFVKKNGPLQKANPNNVKRKSVGQLISLNQPGSSKASSSKKRPHSQTQIDVEFDFDSEDFKKILNAKSAHDDELEVIQHEEYFGKLEKKEALENKLLNTFSLETNAVMCRQCKYVALSQSEFCKEQMHQIRLVKARKRFFKCKDCGNRTMSLDRLPKRPCNNCNSSSWMVAPVGKERKGPTLPSEMLSVRGHEETNIGSAGAKMFMHLEV